MKIELYNSDNLEIMAKMPDESIDIICIDPPYLYLKNQKLERPFNERLFFLECARLLTKNGFIIIFGRGDSFYRWNNLLNNLIEYKEGDIKYGFKVFNENGNIINKYKFKENIFTFKEEIIWDKRRTSSPLSVIGRVHETITIYCKGFCELNKVKVPYLEAKTDITAIIQDIKRIKPILNNIQELQDVENYLKNGVLQKRYGRDRLSASVSSKINTPSPCANSVRAIKEGHLEKTIIQSVSSRKNTIHPTQKPVRLLERLLKLVIPMKKDKIVVADWFADSFSCCEAVINLQAEFPEKVFEFIGTEIDEEYFNLGENRINNRKQCTP